MTATPLTIVVLGAGKGTRMKSDLPKVMHKIAGRPMLGHVLDVAAATGANQIAVVIGPNMDAVGVGARAFSPQAQIFVQAEQLGTADAVKAALPVLKAFTGDVIVLYADTPLLQPATLERLRKVLAEGAAAAVLGFEAADPTGYGRLLTDANGTLTAIREEKDATTAERQIQICNSGVMAFRVNDMAAVLARISNDNAKGEYYLTDAIEVIATMGGRAAVVTCPESEVLGVNDRGQLAEAEAIFQTRRRGEAMAAGATLIAPETVWFSHDTRLGRDVVIQPNVFFGPGVVVEDGVEILANCHIEGAHIGSGARIGPFARLRPGAQLGTGVHIGNFVEVKNVKMGQGAKANHLAYLGDGSVGDRANIGAGTIFCNYDGFFKHQTSVGKEAFVGSNSALVAPVTIGDGAYVGSGSVITKDVSAGSLALERSSQVERPTWAEKFRLMMSKKKKAEAKT